MATRLDTSTDQLLHAQPEPFPYAYLINGRAPQSLTSWPQLSDLLSLVGMTPDCSFLIVERTDGVERWAQAIGYAHALVVELGLPDSRTPDSSTPSPAGATADLDRPHTLNTSASTQVQARRSDLWNTAEAALLMRAWLHTATLGLDGVTLRTPDDWH